eukprot:15471142-Alexandrium_andersonii.AAC.1
MGINAFWHGARKSHAGCGQRVWNPTSTPPARAGSVFLKSRGGGSPPGGTRGGPGGTRRNCFLQ